MCERSKRAISKVVNGVCIHDVHQGPMFQETIVVGPQWYRESHVTEMKETIVMEPASRRVFTSFGIHVK